MNTQQFKVVGLSFLLTVVIFIIFASAMLLYLASLPIPSDPFPEPNIVTVAPKSR
jgi:hypothetical protein